MKEFKPQVLTFKSNTVMDGLDKVAKNVLVHIKANRKVYIQIGKVCIYATLTVAGLLIDNITGYATDVPAWAQQVDSKANTLYSGLTVIAQWVIICRALWEVVSEALHGEIRKAPSIMFGYGILIAIIYSVPWLMSLAKDIFSA